MMCCEAISVLHTVYVQARADLANVSLGATSAIANKQRPILETSR